MLIGIVGKSNVGKTSFFSAATLVDAQISNRIFTTIEPNKGVTYVRSACPCKSLSVKCNPRNSKCVNGTRYVPLKVVDVAGLVPGAHEGRGLGNQFLSDIMEANALIHVIDLAGATDEQGNPVPPLSRDPKEDIKFLKEEIDYWILGILKRNLPALARRMESNKEKLSSVLFNQLAGLGIKAHEIEDALAKCPITLNSPDDQMLEFIEILREKSKPIVIAGNKIDIEGAHNNLERLNDLGYDIIPCSAQSELALRKAAENGIISYMPGDSDFRLLKALNRPQETALKFIKQRVLEKYKSTGVQSIIDKTVFNVLSMIIVYPVENEHKFSDKKGAVLPDAFLMRKGSTAHDLAYKVHEDIGRKFVAAVDARTGKHLSGSYELKDGDIISIRASK